jgi:hypothetical protein
MGYLGTTQQCAGDAEQLPLPDREVVAILGHAGLKAFRDGRHSLLLERSILKMSCA